MSRRPAAAVLVVLVCGTLAACGGDRAPSKPRLRATPTSLRTTVATLRTGTTPVAVAVDADALWVANGSDGTVTRLDPRTRRAVGRPIPVGAGPVAIASGTGGVWVALASGRVVRIDPATNRRVGPAVAVADPAGIAIAAGRVWVSSRERSEVVRIDAETGRRTGAPIRVGAKPTDVAAGLGAVWVAGSGDGTVTRIAAADGAAGRPVRVADQPPLDPGTGGAAIPQPGSGVLGLAVGEGAVWVAKTDDPLASRIEVVRLDAAGKPSTTTPTAVTGGIPMRLATGGGRVWVTDVGSLLPGSPRRAPRLLAIDPGTRRLSGTPIPLGAQPAGVAADDAGVWVANAGQNTLTEVGRG